MATGLPPLPASDQLCCRTCCRHMPCHDSCISGMLQKNSSYRTGASSLMGYKGIPTRYLNSSTISIPTVDKAGSQREQTFH